MTLSPTGKGVGGNVELGGQPLMEGSKVTVISSEESATFDVSPDEERALHAAIAQADHGEVVSWDDVKAQLCSGRRGR